MDNNFQREACMEELSESRSQNRPSEEVRADPVIAPSGLGSDVHHKEEVRADAPSGFGPALDQGEGLRADSVIPPSGMGSDVGQECVILQNQVPEASSGPNQTDVCAAQASQIPNSMNQTNINPAQAPNTSNASVSKQRYPGISIAERAKRKIIRKYDCQRQRKIKSLQTENEPLKRRIDELKKEKNELSKIIFLQTKNESLERSIDELKKEKNELSEYLNKLRTEPPNRRIESLVESNHQQGGIFRDQTNLRTAEASQSPNSINQTNVNSAQAPSTSHAFVSGQKRVRSFEAERTESESDQDHQKRQKQCKEEMQLHVKALTIENESLEKANESLKKENASMNQSVRDQNQEIHGLRNELLKCTEESQSLVEALIRENESLNKENKSIKNDNASMKQTLRDQAQEFHKLRQKFSKCTEESLNEFLNEVCESIRNNNASLKQILRDQNQETDILMDKLLITILRKRFCSRMRQSQEEIAEEDREIRLIFEAIEYEHEQLVKEADGIHRQSARNLIRLDLVIHIVRALKDKDLDIAASLTKFLRDLIQ